jgi:hypothetical protein
MYSTVEDVIVNAEVRFKYQQNLIKKQEFMDHSRQMNFKEYNPSKRKPKGEETKDGDSNVKIEPTSKDNEKNTTSKYKIDPVETGQIKEIRSPAVREESKEVSTEEQEEFFDMMMSQFQDKKYKAEYL